MKKGLPLAPLFTALALAALPAPAFSHGGHGMEEAPPPSQTKEIPAPMQEPAAMPEPPPPQAFRTSREAPFANLPGSSAVPIRGCTIDGHVIRVIYNMAVNLEDIHAAAQSRIKPDAKARLGAAGADSYLGAITSLFSEIDASMQDHVGALLDSVPLKESGQASFSEKINEASRRITEDAKTRHGIAVAIETSPVEKTGASCPALQ